MNVIDKLLEEGWNVVVIAPIDEYLEYKEKYPQVQHFNLRTLDRDSKNPFKDLLLTAELTRRYRKLKPDVIVHYTNKPNIYGGIAAKLSGSKSIAVITGLGYAFIRKGWIRKVTTWLYKYTSGFHQKMIFENSEDKALFEKLGIVKKQQGISIKGCGVDTTFFYPYPNGQEHSPIVFTFIGRLLYDKGIREYIQAADAVKELHNNVEFWIVGELDPQNPATIDKDDLIKWINNKTVVYHGFQRDVRKFIAASDCIVLPSYREGLPRIIMEGMAMSKAVITTDAAGCRETVDAGDNGFLVDIKSASSLTKAMESYLNMDHGSRLEMGKKGRLKALKEFDSKKIAAEIFEIINSVYHH